MVPIGNEFSKLGEEARCLFLADFETIDADPLAIVDEVRGGEEAAAEGESLAESVNHRAGRPLAIGAGHVNDLGAVRGESQEFSQQAGWPLQPKFDSKGLG